MLADTWLLTMCATVLATAWPALSHAAEVDFAAVTWGSLTLAALNAALVAHSMTGASAGGRWLGAVSQAAGVLILGYIWHHAGGLQNPAFLIAFALPIIGATSMGRPQVYFAAALSIGVFAVVALAEAPELRWYVAGLGRAGEWIAASFAAGSRAAGDGTFPGFYAPSGYFVVALEVFSVLVIGCALAAEQLTLLLERLGERLCAARGAADRARDLGAQLIDQLPIPALTIDADSLTVLRVSVAFAATQWAVGGSPIGRKITETVPFCYPEMVEDVVAGAGGQLRPCLIRINGELRVLELRVEHFSYERHRVALLLLEDITLPVCTRAALDASDDAVLIVDADGDVIGRNKRASVAFGPNGATANVRALVQGAATGARWWDPGLARRRKVQVTIGERRFLVTSTAVELPGESDAFQILAFAPTSVVHHAGEPVSDATLVIPPLVAPR